MQANNACCEWMQMFTETKNTVLQPIQTVGQSVLADQVLAAKIPMTYGMPYSQGFDSQRLTGTLT